MKGTLRWRRAVNALIFLGALGAHIEVANGSWILPSLAWRAGYSAFFLLVAFYHLVSASPRKGSNQEPQESKKLS